jgi:hypothetical protein
LDQRWVQGEGTTPCISPLPGQFMSINPCIFLVKDTFHIFPISTEITPYESM